MGYMMHHSIAVSSSDDKLVKKARKKALDIFGDGMVTEILHASLNGYDSFFVGPDGSKEGWSDSNEMDSLRAMFIRWIDKQAYDDGSNCLRFVEFTWGEDDHEQPKVVRGN